MAEFVPATARARIAQLDIEIRHLRDPDSGDSLVLERQNLRQDLADYKYPVLTLPTEITSEIFIRFVPWHSRLVDYNSPAFLLQICRHWRDVALTTPALWSSFWLCIYDEPVQIQLRKLQTWLQRSKDYPLSFHIQCVYGPRHQAMDPIIDAVVSHASRWQHVNIFLPSIEKFGRLVGPMPLLRSACVDVEDWGRGKEATVAVALFTEAPNLKHAFLHVLFEPSRLALPWSQLTTLTAEFLFPAQAIEILCNAKLLQYCSMTIRLSGHSYTAEHSSAVPSFPPLPLRTLRLLADSDDPGLEMPALFKAFTLPALQCLYVDEQFLQPDPIASLRDAFCSCGFPQKTIIWNSRLSTYKTAFPDAYFLFEWDDWCWDSEEWQSDSE
ncbi:hypothetical protein FB45DRAFT_1148727 [Roridomyces roridus]|uniref:F-box domain-containing protein n=1 Tax=Roridomyces roridus TaxID=1738132 RepID=A0AAD7FQH4_9AGAR|nr:hypothetical protein FB45DRAFT_1148727 [Roridomyces roridus]